ncbi:hypothetical protein GCM10027404_29140 [Arthrobacter tumbae]|uniref:PIG-L deacetylase family protein n=1 Tax=Arthrobacter tumbae TaxID=163874 RepID=UPI00195DA6FE|nr:PIG-L family deacetylase [Arthrobacter tumbae]MBM7782970.1 LmbE family N-acetylglucosaminyl deacetylase [Arthrobacter tumbae]
MGNRIAPGRTLMLVVAHPDDDAYGLAGTVALHADDPDFGFILVHATDGAAGDIAPGFPATRENLGLIRREECRRAWKALGREPDRHEWLNYDDGTCRRSRTEAACSRCTARVHVPSLERGPGGVGNRALGPDPRLSPARSPRWPDRH